MSSRINGDDDSDPILRYAPRRAREQSRAPREAVASLAGRPSPPADAIESYGDRVMVGMRQRLALDPECVPEPPQEARPRRYLWPLVFLASIALGAAAGVAWFVVTVPGVTQLGRSVVPSPEAPIRTSSRSAVPPSGTISPTQPLQSVVESPRPKAIEQPDPPVHAPAAPSTDAASTQPPVDLETALAERARRGSASEPTAAMQRAAPDFVTRQLDRDEIASMLRRADDFIKAGDLSSARLLLRRATEAGSEQAALTLAGTFDPNVLAARGILNRSADIALARLWYERAAQLGSSEAPQRLRQLANNSPE